MGVTAMSTVTVLCYARKTEFDFHALATEMSKALWDRSGAMRLDMPDPGLALCDLPGMRIGLADIDMTRTFPGTRSAQHFPACMLLSVGPGDRPFEASFGTGPDTETETDPDTRMTAHYARARAELVARLQQHGAADRVLEFERPGPFDAEMQDIMVDDLRAHLDKVLASRRAPVSDRKASTVRADTPPRPRRPVEKPEDILQTLALRLEAELDRLESARRALEEAGEEAGNGTETAPRTPLHQNARQNAQPDAARRDAQPQSQTRRPTRRRRPLPRRIARLSPATTRLLRMPRRLAQRASPSGYAPGPANTAHTAHRPLLYRAAVNALNISVLAIALPIGAALLTMALFGREDMLLSGRVTALTGIGVGLKNTGAADVLLSLFS